MKTFRFRNIIILATIAIGLNVFNLSFWLKSRNDEVNMVNVNTADDQQLNAYATGLLDAEEALPKSKNYIDAINSFNRKDYAIAVNELNVEAENNPKLARTYFLLGRIYEIAEFSGEKYFSKMVKNFEKYIELKPEGHWVEYAKLKAAQYYISIGLTQQSPAMLDKAEKYLKAITKDSSEVRMALGAIYMDQNNFKKAIAEFEKSANLQPNELNLKYNSLGLAYIKTGRYGNAENALKIAIQIEPENKFAHNNLGFVYLRLKKFKDARVQFEEALKIDPKYKNAKENLEWLDSKYAK